MNGKESDISTVLSGKISRSPYPLAAVGLVSALLAGRLFRLVDRYAVNIFFSDQWDFNRATLFEKHTLWQIFTWKHGPHRQGVGGILSFFIEPLFRWNSRTESFLIVGIIVLAMVLALWLKTRLYGPIEYCDLVIPLIFLTPTQIEVIFGTANLSHGSLPLLMVVLYCLTWTIRKEFVRYSLLLVLNFFLTFTGFGVFMGFMTPLALLWKYAGGGKTGRNHLQYASLLAISLCSIALFFVHYPVNPAGDCLQSTPLRHMDYFWFVSAMFADFLGLHGFKISTFFWGNALSLLMLVVFAAETTVLLSKRNNPDKTGSLVGWLLTGYSLLFCLATARGRLCLGLEAAASSRYMPYLIPGVMGIYFQLRSWENRSLRSAGAGLALAVAIYAGGPVHAADRRTMEWFRHGKSAWKTCYLDQRDIGSCDRQADFRIYPIPEETHLREKLDFLEKNKLNLFSDRE